MSDDKLSRPEAGELLEKKESSVVAWLVIEIRSDGLRTVARGVVEDVQSGERVELHAEGATPLTLIGSLLKSLADVPTLAQKTARLLLNKPK